MVIFRFIFTLLRLLYHTLSFLSRVWYNTRQYSTMKATRTPNTETATTPKCPECGTPMGKKGKRWSGRHQKQLWLCSACGRTKLLPIDGNGHQPEASRPFKARTKPTIKPPQDNHHRLCDGSYEFGGVERHCKMSENGYCARTTFPVSCPKYDRVDWEALSRGKA